MRIFRGDIFFVDLSPTIGREIDGGKVRPVAVLSINFLNHKGLVVSVVPGTSVPPKKDFRNVVMVRPEEHTRLKMATWFQCHQIRAVDQSRFTTPAVGRLHNPDIVRIEEAVRFCLGL